MAYPGDYPGPSTYPGAGGPSASATLDGGGSLAASTVVLANVVTLTAITLDGGGSVTATQALPVVSLGDVTIHGGGTIVARPATDSGTDPRTGIHQWRYVITDLQGTPLGELSNIEHDVLEDGINLPTTMPFTMAIDDPARALIKPIERQCQVWQGEHLRLRGPILPGKASDDGTTITYTVHDPSWWWRDGRKRIGRVPKLNVLRNGDFTQGLTYWTLGYDADSIPKANPVVTVVPDDYTDGGKAAQINGVETITENKSELQSSAVYWPNRPFAWEPLAAGFRPGGAAAVDAVAQKMPTTSGLKVTIVGHTANDGTGDGMALSLRRAQAAAARVQALRPGAVITTRGVGFHDPNPAYPIDSQQQRRVVISYQSTTTIQANSKQWMRQTVEITQPKDARYPLEVLATAALKVTDDWSVSGANMDAIKLVARRKSAPSKPWDPTKGVSTTSISDTDPVGRWLHPSTSVTVPCDGQPYLVDVYLYAPAAQARYTHVSLEPQEELYFWGVDQALIAKGLVEHMQDPITMMGHAWPITVGTRTPLTGIVRDRAYPFHERMPIDTALEGLMALSRGLDIDVLTTPTDTTVATFHPRQGQTLDYALVLGGNVARAVEASTHDVGSLVIAQAQDYSSSRDEAYAMDPAAFGGLALQRLITAEQETPHNELDETAVSELEWAKTATPSYWLDIDPQSVDEVLAKTSKGDTCRLILDWPESVDTPARIVKRQIHPDSLRLMVALEGA